MHELEQFRSNENKLVSINGYLSTSRVRDIAIRYATDDVTRPDTVPVLYEIDCFRDNDWPIFADVARFSDFPKEKEVLFDIGAVF